MKFYVWTHRRQSFGFAACGVSGPVRYALGGTFKDEETPTETRNRMAAADQLSEWWHGGATGPLPPAWRPAHEYEERLIRYCADRDGVTLGPEEVMH